ncbi:hypothetical protein [Nonomuraea fuscirosea]|uniref:hypothetical protein n=1 Tax=Nonomuraea fuscirosea TaxID=1291556 RepID=UPI0033CF0B02
MALAKARYSITVKRPYGDPHTLGQIVIDRDNGDLLALQDDQLPASRLDDRGIFDSYVAKRLGWTNEAPGTD